MVGESMSIVTRCTLLLVAIQDGRRDADVLEPFEVNNLYSAAPVYSRNLFPLFRSPKVENDRPREIDVIDHIRFGYLSVS